MIEIQKTDTQSLADIINFLKKNRIIRFDKEIIDKLGYNKSHFSQVKSGRVPFTQNMLNEIVREYKLIVIDSNTRNTENLRYINNQLSDPNNINEDRVEYFSTKNNDFIIVNDRIFMKVYNVPMKAHAQYVDEFYTEGHDVTFSYQYVLVEQYGKGNYKNFIIEGDSMDDGSRYSAPHGATVLTREIGQHLWSGGLYKAKRGHIIVTNRNFLYKDIVGFDKNTGLVTLHSRNNSDEYKDFTLPLGFMPDNQPHIKQIFKVVKIGNI